MIKSELIKQVSKEAGLSQTTAKEVTEAILKSIEGALAKGEKVSLQGFGTFYTKEIAAIDRPNPLQGGEMVHISARNRVFFRPSEKIKESVNQ